MTDGYAWYSASDAACAAMALLWYASLPEAGPLSRTKSRKLFETPGSRLAFGTSSPPLQRIAQKLWRTWMPGLHRSAFCL
jgi:hypothetical protein